MNLLKNIKVVLLSAIVAIVVSTAAAEIVGDAVVVEMIMMKCVLDNPASVIQC